jgi:hypothetical protein
LKDIPKPKFVWYKINFELFRESLNGIYKKTDAKSTAGAKPYDYVWMFKIIILQRLYNLSDEQGASAYTRED